LDISSYPYDLRIYQFIVCIGRAYRGGSAG